jgi:hypothetical protein
MTTVRDDARMIRPIVPSPLYETGEYLKSGLFVSLLKYRRNAHNSSQSSRARSMTRNIQRVFLAAAALACGETPTAPPLGVPTPLPTQVVEGVRCVVDTRTRQMSCGSGEEGSPTATRSRSGGNGINVDLIVGGQNTFIKLTSSNVTYSGEVFSFTTTVQNLIPQSLGTTDGTTLDTAGVKVFFEQEPVFTSGSGTIDFVDPIGGGSLVDGFATFTRANQPYYKYNQILHPNEVSAGKLWRMHIPTTVTSFAFTVYVSAPVQYPTGWIDVTPPVTVLQTGQTQQLTAVVRDVVGRVQAGAPVTWGTSNASAATVDASGLVTAVGDGAATITATSTTRTGTALITVATPTVLNINAGDGQTALVGAAVATAPSVVVLDQNGAPVPNIQVTFSVTGGGGSATTLVATTNASGIATVGSWTLGAGGVGCAAATITNCTRNTLHAVATGGASPAVDIKGYIPPIVPATATYQAVGNATLPVVAGIGVLQGAFSINGNGANGQGATLTVTTPSPVGSQSGTVTIAGDGSFSYLSSPTYVSVGAATENFTYTVTDGIASITSNAALQVNVPEHVFYVQPGFGGTSTGSDVQPFKDFSGTAGQGVEAVAVASDTILVFVGTGAAVGGTLKNGQFVYGQGASVPKTFPTGSAATYRNGGQSITLLAAPVSSPQVGALTLGVGNTLRGFTVVGNVGAALTGNSFGTLTVGEVNINAGFQALSLTTGTVAGAFTSVNSAGGTNNVLLSSVSTSGTFALGNGALSGATSDAFKLSGGGGTFTYAGTISNSTALAVSISSMTGGGVTLSGNINTLASPNRGIQVAGNTGGTVTLSGAEIGISSGASVGISFAFNSAAFVFNVSPTTALQITSTSATSFSASNAGTITVTGGSNTINATSGPALSINGPSVGAGGVNFSSVTSTGSTTNVNLTNVGGTGAISLGNGALSGASGTSFQVNGGANAITYGGTITKTVSGQLIVLSGRTAGSITLSGNLSCTSACGSSSGAIAVSSATGGVITFSGTAKTINTPTAGLVGVALTGNAGSTISFATGGLAITTGTGAGFTATGGGTVDVPAGGTSTISTTSGTPFNMANTTIGGSGIVFRSITNTIAAGNGIVLNNTGAGPFSVTGDGASDPANTTRGRTTAKLGGGTVALGSGGTLTSTSGSAASFTTTGAVTLRDMNITGSSNGDGVVATSVSGLTLDNMLITGKTFGHGVHATSTSNLTLQHMDINSNATDASTAAADIWNVRLDDVSGTTTVQNTTVNTGFEHIFQIKNTTATTAFNVTNANFSGAGNGDGLDIYAYGSSNITANIQGSTFANNSSFGFDSGTQTTGSGSLNLTINNSTFTNNFVGADVAHGSSGSNTFNLTNNNFQTNVASSSQAINVNRLGDPSFTGFGLFSGTVSGNTIGTAGVANSGSDVGDGITVKTNGNGGTIRVSILNNIIREYGQHGIGISARDATTGHTLHARVQGNNIANGKAAISLDGINVLLGALNTDHVAVCLDIGGAGLLGNTVTAAVRTGIRVRSSGTAPGAVTAFTAPGYDGTGATYFSNRNPAATGVVSNANFANGGGTNNAGNCTTP